jgi:hypothetical protein
LHNIGFIVVFAKAGPGGESAVGCSWAKRAKVR